MEFEEACSEMYYILEHMSPVDIKRIPDATIKFFKDNKSILYKVKFDVTKRLEEQDLKDETKAFIQILNAKYFSNETEKNQFNDDIFNEDVETKIEKNMELAVIEKENIILTFFKKLLNKFLRK